MPPRSARRRLYRRGSAGRRRTLSDGADGRGAAAAGRSRCSRRTLRWLSAPGSATRRRSLALLARSVIALEEDPGLARLGRSALVDHRIASVTYVEAPLPRGHRARAPYDVILFGGAVGRGAGGDQRPAGRRRAAGCGLREPGSGRPRHSDNTDWCGTRARVIFDAATPLLPGFEAEPVVLCSEGADAAAEGMADARSAVVEAGRTGSWRGRRPCWPPAAPASAQTLTEALAYAYQNNPQLLAQRASLRATDETGPAGALADGGRPSTSPARPGSTAPVRPSTSLLTGETDTTQYQQLHKAARSICRSTQPIYRGGRTEAQTKQAINTVQAARAQTLVGRDHCLSGGRHGLSRRRARPDPARGRPQQRAGPAQAAGGDARPVPGRRGDPDRCRAGRIRAGAGDRAADHRRGHISRSAGAVYAARSAIRRGG